MKTIREIAVRLSEHPVDAGLMDLMHRLKRHTDEIGGADVWNEIKLRCNQMAIKLYPLLKERVVNDKDPLLCAAIIASAGNNMDVVIDPTGNTASPLEDTSANSLFLATLQKTIDSSLRDGFKYADYREFKNALSKSHRIVYIGDNAGEIVFDRLVLEEIRDHEVTYVVRGASSWNDVTADDARFAGIESVATVVSTEEEYPLRIVKSGARELAGALDEADMIISKGMLNYELVSPQLERSAFYIFQVKCNTVREHLGSKGNLAIGDNVLIMQ